MAVTETLRALGSWGLQLTAGTPREVITAIQHLGHIAIHAGPVDPRSAGDSLLESARYVGVVRLKRGRSDDNYEIGGPGMAFWLGDEEGKGNIFEGLLAFDNETFPDTIRALLPASGAVIEGTLFNTPPNFTGTLQFAGSRQAIEYLTTTLAADWRVNGNATLDAGLESDLFVTNPETVVARRVSGIDMQLRGYRGELDIDQDASDFTTKVILLAADENGSYATATAELAPGLNPYTDLHGNPVNMTRIVQESGTDATNAQARAQLQLNRFSRPTRDALQLSTAQYDIKGDLAVGDYLWVFDSDIGLEDFANEVMFRGARINPMKLRLIELTWPIVNGMSVAYRAPNNTWWDLTQYLIPEIGETALVVGDFNRALTGGGNGAAVSPIPPAPNINTSIPDAPTWLTPFTHGTYQSQVNGETKAQTELKWLQPTNTDGSTITDGAHYEIRYRSATTPLFPVTHAQMAVYTHAQLASNGGTFGQPIQYAIGDWQYQFVPFDRLSVILYELTPSMPYEAQIRAIDNGQPANAGAWATLTAWQTAQDTLGPSTPAAPEVAASLIAVQIMHRLGKSTGGTFNLDRDLHHIEIHGEYEPGFQPSESTRLGRLLANSNMIIAQTPVVGTFAIPDLTPVYFKVVAVDTAGNKSGPSAAAVATAQLIDDAHISNLSVSKLTAGTITASFVHAGWMRIGAGTPGAGGASFLELTPFGIQAVGPTGNLTVSLDAATGNISLTGGGNVIIQDGAVLIKNAAGNTIVELGECLDGRHGLQVYTDTGVRTARIGELAAGGHGIEVIDEVTGALVKVSTLAFGQRAASVAGGGSVGTGGAFVDIPGSFGPQVSATIGNSGNAIVVIGARLFATNGGVAVAGFTVSGATTRAADYAESLEISDEVPAGFGTFLGASRVVHVSGLTPGVNTFTAKYYASAPALSNVVFEARHLIVIPF